MNFIRNFETISAKSANKNAMMKRKKTKKEITTWMTAKYSSRLSYRTLSKSFKSSLVSRRKTNE